MRILHLVHSFAPEAHGGTQGYVQQLARGLMAEGHAVAVFAASNDGRRGPAVGHETVAGIPVTRFFRDFGTERLSGDLGSPRLMEAILAEARRFAPDIVHVHHWHGLDRTLARRMKADLRTPKGAPVPVLISLHDLFTTCPRHFRMPDARRFCADDVPLETCAACVAPDVAGVPEDHLAALLGDRLENFRAEIGAADRVFAMSRAQKDLLARLKGFPADRLIVSPIGVPRDLFAAQVPAASRLPGPASAAAPLRIVSWAGIDPRKGTHILVAAAAATKRPEAITLDFHGAKGESDYMSELLVLGRDLRMRFHGRFADEDRPRFAAAADLTVLPFLSFETHGLVVDEALALGLPVIVADRGAPPERVGGRGMTFPAGDTDHLRSILDRLLDDPAPLALMRTAAHGARPLEDHLAELFLHYHALDGA